MEKSSSHTLSAAPKSLAWNTELQNVWVDWERVRKYGTLLKVCPSYLCMSSLAVLDWSRNSLLKWNLQIHHHHLRCHWPITHQDLMYGLISFHIILQFLKFWKCTYIIIYYYLNTLTLDCFIEKKDVLTFHEGFGDEMHSCRNRIILKVVRNNKTFCQLFIVV
jgi:hypothetical protein